MLIEKGTLLEVNHSRSGKWTGIATEDFDTTTTEFYPIALATGNAEGVNKSWVAGDNMPCRNTLCTIRRYNQPKCLKRGKRGELTERIQTNAKWLLKREITVDELRLMAHLQYVMCNEQKIDASKINEEDKKTLDVWRKEGHIQGGFGGITITKKFWDIICQILYFGYVDRM